MGQEDLPYVILKYASTINGIIGSNNNQRLILSNDLDRKKVMEIRSKVDAIVIGAGTLIKDNPQLTIRDEDLVKERVEKGLKPQLTRVVLASRKLEHSNFNIFTDKLADTILFTNQIDLRIPSHVKQILNDKDESGVVQALKKLKQLRINSVLIEGGAKLIAEVIEQNIANRIRILYSPVCVNGGIKIPIKKNIDLDICEKKIELLGNQFAITLDLTRRE